MTSRRRRWIRSPRRRSTARLMRSQGTGRRFSSLTGCPPASSAMRSLCLTRVRSSSRAAMPRCLPTAAANTAPSGTHRRSIIQSKASRHKQAVKHALVGASIARPCPFVCEKAFPESVLLRQVGGRPMVAPTYSIRQECDFLIRTTPPLHVPAGALCILL